MLGRYHLQGRQAFCGRKEGEDPQILEEEEWEEFQQENQGTMFKFQSQFSPILHTQYIYPGQINNVTCTQAGLMAAWRVNSATELLTYCDCTVYVQYACRKTLADSRPRVRGRFAKNDDFGDVTVARPSMGNHEDDAAVDEAARHNFLYDPNNYPAAAALSHGGRIFNSNCLAAAPGAGPYDMCTTLFCADANMHWWWPICRHPAS